jgi:hypothetical protein
MSELERKERCWRLLDDLRGLLDQGWFYQGSKPGRSQSECRTTECADLLAIVAELCGDCQRMADALNEMLVQTVALEMGTEALRKVTGVNLVSLAHMYEGLARDLAAAGNHALDTIGDKHNVTKREQFRIEEAEPQCLCDSGDR